jgi:CPA1 family monovalent cation:H+ antiporter
MISNTTHLFYLSCLFITAIAYLNHCYFKLPTTIAIMASGLLFSLFVLVAGKWGFTHFQYTISNAVNHINFSTVLLQGMLSFMLFAGAMNINIYHLFNFKVEISLLAIGSTILSTLLIALLCYYLLPLIHFNLNFIYCLLFGALISPTDPIAVLALFKTIGGNHEVDITLTGESLFNDGVGIALFMTLIALLQHNNGHLLTNFFSLFLREFAGGIAFGCIIGSLGRFLLKPVTSSKVALLMTLTIVMVGYAIANHLEISGPLAMVAAGIIIGTETQKNADLLHSFWELLDDLLNSFLFFLVGIELLQIPHSFWSWSLAFAAIAIVLIVRCITVFIPIHLLSYKKRYPKNYIMILIWGGLRGGLAIALALSIPSLSYEKDILLNMTYCVVIFSILIQGLSISKLLAAK